MNSFKEIVKNTGTKKKIKSAKTAQETVPFKRLYKNGIIETDSGIFSKTYKIDSVNFTSLSKADQTAMFGRYREFLNSFSPDVTIQITLNNRNTDRDALLRSITCKSALDKYNDYRDEINTMLEDKLNVGNSCIINERCITVSVKSRSITEAMNKFIKIDGDIDTGLKNISGMSETSTKPLSSEERVKQLHDILNVGHETDLKLPIDFAANKKMNIPVHDLIAPSSFEFKKDYMMIGDKYAKALFLKSLPLSFSTEFMADLSTLPFNYLANIEIEPISPDEAIKKVTRKATGIRKDVMAAQQEAAKSNYSPDLISPTLKTAREQMEFLQEDLRDGSQKLFGNNVVFLVFGDTKEEVSRNAKSLISIGSSYTLTISDLFLWQEIGFRSALPLGICEVPVTRSLTTDGVSLFIPFSTKELIEDGGIYYGLNAISNNLIMYNRLAAKNQNALIVGVSGSGKSFAAKREMAIVYLTTNHEIYVLDPENEYGALAEALDGSVVRLEAGSKVYINPFDMDIQYGDSEDAQNSNPVTMKSDYICMLCETAMGGRYEISTIERSIIDRVVIQLYKPYMAHMAELNDKSITCDTDASPTMDDFYELLMAQPEREAVNIALALEIYCRGSFDTFAHRTNVDVNNRFTVYNINKIGTGMKEMGVQVCLNHVWNKIISNQSKGKHTWFYLDEFHLLTKTHSSAAFLQQIWKRARKWNGVPTAITQDVEDLLTNSESRAIINNCNFIMMFSQSPMGRAALAEMYNISETLLPYITGAKKGQGLLYNGQFLVPFVDDFPKDTKLYKMLTSDGSERKVA